MSFSSIGSDSSLANQDNKDCYDLESNLVATWVKPDQNAVEDLRKPWNSSSSSESFENEGGLTRGRIVSPCIQRSIVGSVRNDIDKYCLKESDNTAVNCVVTLL